MKVAGFHVAAANVVLVLGSVIRSIFIPIGRVVGPRIMGRAFRGPGSSFRQPLALYILVVWLERS